LPNEAEDIASRQNKILPNNIGTKPVEISADFKEKKKERKIKR